MQSVSNNEKLNNKKVTNVFAPSLFYFDVYSEATCQVRSIFDSIGQLVKFLKINHKTLPGAVKLKIKPKTKKSGKKYKKFILIFSFFACYPTSDKHFFNFNVVQFVHILTDSSTFHRTLFCFFTF